MTMEEQQAYLVNLERDLNWFEESEEPRERTLMVTIRNGLADIRKRIHERSEWWANEPKLKELESRFEKLLQATTLTKH
jgi:hypothetical protein